MARLGEQRRGRVDLRDALIATSRARPTPVGHAVEIAIMPRRRPEQPAPRGRPLLYDDQPLVPARTGILPSSRAYVERVAAERDVTVAAVLRELIEEAIERRSEPRCRSCGADIAGMPAYRRGEPRERCDACEV